MKKILASVLALTLGTSLLAGCSSGGNEPEEPTVQGGKVKLKAIMTKHPLTQKFENMKWLQDAEERAGVDIEWQEVSADWDQKKGAMLASGDIPDLIVGVNSITDSDFAQFPGLFQDLSGMIDPYAPNVKAMFDAKPETKIIATQQDGKIYGLPKYQRFWPDTATRQFINKEWLNQLGLQMPTTWDELFDVLKAFKDKDANGNGDPNDEIPMDFAPTGTVAFGYFMPTVLLGSEGITLSDGSGSGYFVEDGQVKNFFIDDRYKELVKFLNKCFSAGLINPEVFTQDYTKYQSVARGKGNTATVGFTWGWEVTDRFGNAVSPQYTTMAPLKFTADSTVQQSWSYDYNTLNYGTNTVQMSAASKHKEAAMKFINELYNPEVSMQVLFGSLGTNIKDNGDGSFAVLPPQDEAMDPGTWKWTSTWADNGPMYIADSLKLTLGTDMQSVGKQTEPLQKVLDSIDKDNDVFPNLFIKYSAVDNSTMALANTALVSMALAKWSQWITKGGVDKEWDAYVENCKKTGLLKNIEIMQKYYDDYKSKL
ncbi:extracellular solute-binding protein [Paenibacillus sp. PSB04]|uniref:extracellular solute-binding protein n=1 Tax=Paenibacillus sp. PSB04 TaxID=2866810 RepID=UPI0021F120AF|nr:extracellular solute-binding protein [Paenibacillus sp. PSB04]UYO03194.1 extracellular solute-binding protein [Paenibacillus sp. PSB04]